MPVLAKKRLDRMRVRFFLASHRAIVLGVLFLLFVVMEYISVCFEARTRVMSP